MSTITTTLKISELIPIGTDVAETFTIPASPRKVFLRDFVADAVFSSGSEVQVIWDFGGAGEQIIWSAKGAQSFDLNEEIKDHDGVKKIALVCSNGEVGSMVLSGKVIVVMED